ncbi:MAG: hypothetical protein V4549_07745 [Bacteroidota bacterium]
MKTYYTPEPSEFHIGFEYEINTLYPEKHIDGYGFIKTVITTENYRQNMDCIHLLDRVRVKYLDHDDILSLGWKKTSEIQNSSWYTLNEFCLIFSTTQNKIYISDKHDETKFSGTIKNKSELKRLMNQLQINM